jgi:hypothetical protein
VASHTRPAGHSPEETSKTVVNIRFDSALLGRVDADARRLGINRTAWLHSPPTACSNAGSRANPDKKRRQPGDELTPEVSLS